MAFPDRSAECIFKGIAASAGVCHGRVLVLQRRSAAAEQYSVSEEEVGREIQRFEQALIQTRHQIQELQKRVADAMGEKDALIFDAHLLVLEDPMLVDGITRHIGEQRVNVESACEQVLERYTAALSSVEDEFFRERAADVRDVVQRLVGNLQGRSDVHELPELAEPVIVIGHDLAPSMTATMDKAKVLGFATDVGGKTSHTAILARSLRLPAVVGLHDVSQTMVTGQHVLVDGYNGVVILNPTDQTLFEYGQLIKKQLSIQVSLQSLKDEPAITLDNRRIILSANIQQPEECGEVRESGAEGVGLFRTEYLFLNRETLPSEEEQYEAYRRVASALSPEPVVIRTLDIGGDKFMPALRLAPEVNPFLGWRAIRLCLHERDMFRTQLRAILRAAVVGNVKMMYPMVSSLEELIEANALLEACKEELRLEGIAFGTDVEVGVMIEIPSAVLIADALARHVRFFSIGTNDLIQYTLAVDRLNERIYHLYQPTHPAILRLIRWTVEAGHRHGLWVGVCGEMAGDPALVPLLLGLGVDELSTAPAAVPSIKFLIRRLKMPEVKALVDGAMNSQSAGEILTHSKALAQAMAPSLFEARVPGTSEIAS